MKEKIQGRHTFWESCLRRRVLSVLLSAFGDCWWVVFPVFLNSPCHVFLSRLVLFWHRSSSIFLFDSCIIGLSFGFVCCCLFPACLAQSACLVYDFLLLIRLKILQTGFCSSGLLPHCIWAQIYSRCWWSLELTTEPLDTKHTLAESQGAFRPVACLFYSDSGTKSIVFSRESCGLVKF